MKKGFLILLFILVSLIIFTSCQTPPIMHVNGENIQTVTIDDVTLTLKYLDREELKERHGKKINPFILKMGGFTPKKFMVFEIKAFTTDEAELIFNTERIFLTYGNKSKNPLSNFLLYKHWERKDEYKSLDLNILEQKIKQYNISDKNKTISAGNNMRQYIAFMSAFPQFGEAMLSITPLTRLGERAGDFRFNFEFETY